jgi:hypothetical protein
LGSHVHGPTPREKKLQKQIGSSKSKEPSHIVMLSTPLIGAFVAMLGALPKQ